MARRSVTWRGDNLTEVQVLLSQWQVTCAKEGDRLHITGLGGLDRALELGYQVIVDYTANRVGFSTKAAAAEWPRIRWTGDNLDAVYRFLSDVPLGMIVAGRDLYLITPTKDETVVNPGDEIVDVNGHIHISVAGQDHRV